MKRFLYGIFCTIILSILIINNASQPLLAEEPYTPENLKLIVYSDGTVHVRYIIGVSANLPNVTVKLFGLNFESLTVSDENNTLLDYTINKSTIEVDSLGANRIIIEYDTQDLTDKAGPIWTLTINSPINFTATFPSEAVIIELSQAPLGIGSEGQRLTLTMPAGTQRISYIISTTGAKAEAEQAIAEAEQVISSIKAKGIVLTDAEEKILQAKTAFKDGKYNSAVTLANQAITIARSTEKMAEAASTAINEAEKEVKRAYEDGRTVGLNEASSLLEEAKSSYKKGDYAAAENLAEQARTKAQKAVKPQPAWEMAAVITIITSAAIIGAVYAITRRRKRIDVNRILRENPWLRPEQRSILLLLAERGGGAFEADIREALDLPKSTVWRNIKRLEEEGIIEIRQVRRQNYIRIRKR